MNIKPFFPVFIVLVGVVIYAYYAPERKPERATTLTPKQYIEQVEKNKAEKRSGETEQEASNRPQTTSNPDN
jgi:hypothetical protein